MATVTPPARNDISGTAPNPSNAVARAAFGELHDYLMNLLGSAGSPAAALAALGAPTLQYLYMRDQKAANTAGGSSVAGNNIRVLNTVVSNTITGASLASNRPTLPAGTYRVSVRAPCYNGGNHRAFLRNITDSSFTLIGTPQYTDTTANTQTTSTICGEFTIAATKVFEIWHGIGTAVAGNGLGSQMNDAEVEIYTEVEIWRIA